MVDCTTCHLTAEQAPLSSFGINPIAKQTNQSRSSLIRNAIKEYILDTIEDRKRFLEAYKEGKGDESCTLEELKIECDL